MRARRSQRARHADLRSAERASVRRQHHPGRSHQPDHAAGRRHLAAAEPVGPGRQLHREQRRRAGAGRVRHPQRREPGSMGVGLRPLLQSRSRLRRAAHGQHLHGRREPVRVGQLQPRARTHLDVVIEPAQRVQGWHQQVRPRAVRFRLRDPEEQRARYSQRQHRGSPVHLRYRRLQRRRLSAHRLSWLHQLGADWQDGAALGQLHVGGRQALGEIRRRRPFHHVDADQPADAAARSLHLRSQLHEQPRRGQHRASRGRASCSAFPIACSATSSTPIPRS